MSRDFYWEYMKECDVLIQKFLEQVWSVNGTVLFIKDINLEKAISNWLWQKIFLNQKKQIYSNARLNNQDYKAVMTDLWDTELKPLLPTNRQSPVGEFLPIAEKIETLLTEYRNTDLFFCLNERQYKYYLPILESFQGKALIITMCNLDEGLLKKDNIKIVEFDLISTRFIPTNDYIKENFAYLYILTNTFYAILKSIKPKSIIVFEGCHFETEILSSIGKVLEVQTICIQQGWPCLMHTRFTNMTYDYYLTWGSEFNRLWSVYNPLPQFISVGYPYKVSGINNIDKKAIVFFFQAPLFVISENTFDLMIDFVFYCADRFRDRQILIKEHPEYLFAGSIKDKMASRRNIKLVTNERLDSVYQMSEISVSIFSSTLVESIVHHTIPFIFNPTSMPRYNPNLDYEGLGIEVHSLDEAKMRMESLVTDGNYKEGIKNNICRAERRYFDCSGESAVNNIIKVINKTEVPL